MIDHFAAVFAPPKAPIHKGEYGGIRALQKRVGLEFPDDYLDIACHYGSGGFKFEDRGLIRFYNPFDPDYSAFLNQECASLRASRQSTRDDPFANLSSFAVHPEPEGLLPILGDQNSFLYCYRQTGDPNEWPIVGVTRLGETEIFELQLCRFLIGLLAGAFQSWGLDCGDEFAVAHDDPANPSCQFCAFPLRILLGS